MFQVIRNQLASDHRLIQIHYSSFPTVIRIPPPMQTTLPKVQLCAHTSAPAVASRGCNAAAAVAVDFRGCAAAIAVVGSCGSAADAAAV